MSMTTGYYRVSHDELEHIRQNKEAYLSTIENGWRKEGKFYYLDTWAMKLVKELDPTRIGVPRHKLDHNWVTLDVDSICNLLLGERGEILHEHVIPPEKNRAMLFLQDALHTALQEFEQIDWTMLKEHFLTHIRQEYDLQEEDDLECFEEDFEDVWAALMNLKDFFADVAESGDSVFWMFG